MCHGVVNSSPSSFQKVTLSFEASLLRLLFEASPSLFVFYFLFFSVWLGDTNSTLYFDFGNYMQYTITNKIFFLSI